MEFQSWTTKDETYHSFGKIVKNGEEYDSAEYTCPEGEECHTDFPQCEGHELERTWDRMCKGDWYPSELERDVMAYLEDEKIQYTEGDGYTEIRTGNAYGVKYEWLDSNIKIYAELTEKQKQEIENMGVYVELEE